MAVLDGIMLSYWNSTGRIEILTVQRMSVNFLQLDDIEQNEW